LGKTLIRDKWQHVDEAERSSVQEKKIRVLYLPGEGTEKPVATPIRNGVYGADGAVGDVPPSAPFTNLT
jgi:hypothetical protein